MKERILQTTLRKIWSKVIRHQSHGPLLYAGGFFFLTLTSVGAAGTALQIHAG